MANTVKLPQNVWYEPEEVAFPLPDSWQVQVYNIAGYAEPAITPEGIRAAMAAPIGMPPLREVAKGKKEAAIIFDDTTRSTQVSAIVPFVLEELVAAGIKDDRIRFIAAVANHQAMSRVDMVKKLGEDVLARFMVYNHCPFLNCTCVGTTSFGTKAFINSEVMNCDLKIAIGQISPHISQGFSGGGKIIMPGVASYDTVIANHSRSRDEWQEKRKKLGSAYRGVVDENPSNVEVQEIAGMAGLDMIINCIVNMWGETASIFAGALEPAYRAAVEKAKSHYLAANTRDNDIVIANAYIKASECYLAWVGAYPAVKKEGGSFVTIANSPSGQVVHYVFDKFGKTINAGVHRPMVVPSNIRNFIIYSKYPELRILDRFLDRDRVRIINDWDQVIRVLEESHGDSPKVAVYPNADTQYFAD